MKIGVTLWGFGLGVREAVELAVLAEDRGFDSALMVEGVFSNDALTTVAGMAGRTSRITIGTGIANVYLRHPVMLGLAAAAVGHAASDGFHLVGEAALLEDLGIVGHRRVVDEEFSRGVASGAEIRVDERGEREG